MSATADEKGVVLKCGKCGTRNRVPYGELGKTTRCGECKTELTAPGEPVEVSSDSVFEALAQNSALPVIIDFWAEWCGPCKMMAPEFAQAARLLAGRAIAAKVNTEQLPGTSARFRISSIPTMVLMRNGRELSRVSGARPAGQIASFVEQVIPPAR